MAGNPVPDWYPDPANPAVLRWWDGTRWSGETRSAPAAASGRPQQQEGPAAFAPGGSAPFGGPGHAPASSDGFGAQDRPAFPPGTGMESSGDTGPGSRSGLQASWREPAIESWATVYRSAGPGTGRGRFPVRRWVIGGAAAVVVVGAAAWFAVSALSGHPAKSHPTSHGFNGGVVTDSAAGVSVTIPAGAGWAKVTSPSDGFTMMYRKAATGSGSASPGEGSAVAAESLPGTIPYHGPTDLKADGARAADLIAASYFSASHGKPAVSVRSQTLSGEQAYVITFHGSTANSNSTAKTPSASQPAVVVIINRGTGHRPGVLFVTAPGASGSSLISQITATLRTVPGS
jgi:Protein of unknown function (DUF2510)